MCLAVVHVCMDLALVLERFGSQRALVPCSPADSVMPLACKPLGCIAAKCKCPPGARNSENMSLSSSIGIMQERELWNSKIALV